MNADTTTRIPVTVITGFLGSGKTTLLNRLLTERHGMKIAVIENEFGEVGIDDALVIGAEEEVFEMNNGCICCTVRGDLIRILGNLMKRKDRFDRIVIETTGLADPAPVIQTFFVDPEIGSQLELDAVITVVDAAHVLQHLDEVKPEGVENEAMEQIAFADRIILNKCDLVDDATLVSVEGRVAQINRWASVVRSVRADVPIDEVLDIKAFDLGRALELDPKLLESSEHQHDQRVGSVGFEVAGAVDLERLNSWLSELLATKGTDIYRMKGVLAIEGSDTRYVFHGVHMLFEGQPDREWGDTPRTNKLVFIGRDLDRQALQERFAACLCA